MENKKVILIVDDDQIVKLLLSAKLKKRGYDVLLASNGAEGIEALKGSTVHLVLTDFLMPVMNGLDFLVEAGALNTRIPMIMMSSDRTASTLKRAFDSGAIDYLIKPVNTEDLLERIDRYIF